MLQKLNANVFVIVHEYVCVAFSPSLCFCGHESMADNSLFVLSELLQQTRQKNLIKQNQSQNTDKVLLLTKNGKYQITFSSFLVGSNKVYSGETKCVRFTFKTCNDKTFF